MQPEMREKKRPLAGIPWVVSALPDVRSSGVRILPEYQAALLSYLCLPEVSFLSNAVIFDCLKCKYIIIKTRSVVNSF